MAEAIAFYLVAGLVTAGALGVLFSREIVRSAVWLAAALVGVAGLFLLLSANYLAVVQLFLYVGGILVLLVFGIMLTARRPMAKTRAPWQEVLAVGIGAAVLACGLLYAIWSAAWPGLGREPADAATSMRTIGRDLLTTWLLPFELISVLLLAAMIGAAYLARPLSAAQPQADDERPA